MEVIRLSMKAKNHVIVHRVEKFKYGTILQHNLGNVFILAYFEMVGFALISIFAIVWYNLLQL